MKTVRFKYQTELAFSSPASEHRFLLRILPLSDDRQQIESLSWHIDPSPVDTLWKTADGFGNDALAGQINAPHNRFCFGIEGVAEVSGEPYISSGEPPRMLLYPTELTRPHSGLVDFYESINNGINNNTSDDINSSVPINALYRIQHFSHAVHDRLRYERGATANSTSAAEAFDIGAGVCQDYAHILLALLRLDKIPCRYAAGLASDYGETHAWVEAWAGARYIAIDPTRDKLADEGYIALSRGRDFADSSIERGVFKGTCRGTQTVSLSMEIS
ncbi:MAG: transglutaminase family protein [Chitinispirillales bacterium]|nr:transglutaminase family protein [Chitinispirillales bacterium]